MSATGTGGHAGAAGNGGLAGAGGHATRAQAEAPAARAARRAARRRGGRRERRRGSRQRRRGRFGRQRRRRCGRGERRRGRQRGGWSRRQYASNRPTSPSPDALDHYGRAGAIADVTVTINRNVGSTAFTGVDQLEFLVPTRHRNGVTGNFRRNPATQGSATLTVNVVRHRPPAHTQLRRRAAPARRLLKRSADVDRRRPGDDRAGRRGQQRQQRPANTNPTPSASDTAFAAWLQGESITTYNTKVVQGDSDPGYDALKGYRRSSGTPGRPPTTSHRARGDRH